MVEKGRSVEEIANERMKVSQENIQTAYSKIRPSILVQEINEYKEWQRRF
jgi:SpoVK/Ycf46/Vps4 family AAA+-type ATPase